MKAFVVWPHSNTVFGHVFLAVAIDGSVIELDGLHGVPLIKCRTLRDERPEDWYVSQGWSVVEVPLPNYMNWNPRPLMLATCVGMVKRYLNINAFWVQTPAQLYRHLRKKFYG